MESIINENLRNNCANALTVLEKAKDQNTVELQSKLIWCLGSYDNDKNPVGLHEYGVVALETLKNIKKNNPRRINKKIIEGLEKGIRDYEINLN